MSDIIEFNEEETTTAASWHGGGTSLLYAISSTGALKRGTRRPHLNDRPMTDQEWFIWLASNLEGEAEEAADEAKNQIKDAKGNEKRELQRDRRILLEIARKAREAQQS